MVHLAIFASSVQDFSEKTQLLREPGRPEGQMRISHNVYGLHLPVMLCWGYSQTMQASIDSFFDSGAAENFLDLLLALKFQRPSCIVQSITT